MRIGATCRWEKNGNKKKLRRRLGGKLLKTTNKKEWWDVFYWLSHTCELSLSLCHTHTALSHFSPHSIIHTLPPTHSHSLFPTLIFLYKLNFECFRLSRRISTPTSFFVLNYFKFLVPSCFFLHLLFFCPNIYIGMCWVRQKVAHVLQPGQQSRARWLAWLEPIQQLLLGVTELFSAVVWSYYYYIIQLICPNRVHSRKLRYILL